MAAKTSFAGLIKVGATVLVGLHPAAAPLLSSTQASRVLWERSDGPFYSRALVWDVADLTEPGLRRLYGEVSQELRSKRAWTVDVFVDEDDAKRELYGKMRSEVDYSWWLDLYNQFGRRMLPMAEISSYEGSAVVRLRNADGVPSETILSGQNFLRVHLGDTEFEILKEDYHPVPPGTMAKPGDDAMVTVFVRASPFPSTELAKEFSRLMRARFQEKRIVTAFRADSYFLTDAAFPILYRFGPVSSPPSREQYERSKTIYCFCESPDVRCGG